MAILRRLPPMVEQQPPQPAAETFGGVARPTLAALDHGDSAWNRAARRTAQGDPLCCRTEWQLSFHETMAQPRPVFVRAGGDSLIAFAGRLDRRLGPLLEPVEAHWFFGCPLLGPHAVELLAALLAEPGQARAAPTVLVSGILRRGGLRRRLAALCRGRLRAVELEPTILCCASLAGGFDGFLSRRSGGLRRNTRQAARRAADAGVYFERHVPRGDADADAVYARMLAVEERSWKGIGRCGMAEPPARQFYGVLLRRLARSGAGRVAFARRDGDDIGFVFGGLADRVYRGQQFSYVEDWHHASIGNLLQLEQVRWLCEEGATRYDMGPSMDYKRHWTEQRIRIDIWALLSN